MSKSSERFTVEVDGIAGLCPSGEKWAADNMAKGAIPVLSCEGPCIRGDIARLAANSVARHAPYARACYAETALVPHSAMAAWVRQADKVVMIDGCFLRCIGRLMGNLVDKEKVVAIDALPLHKRFADIFHMDDVAEAERKAVAEQTAGKILARLQGQSPVSAPTTCSCGNACVPQ
jgi:uncharacterized metal-binding protein